MKILLAIPRVLFYLFFVSLVVSLSLFTKTLLNPATSRTNSTIWPEVIKKLDTNPNTFSLLRPFSLFPKAQAAQPYDDVAAYIAIDESKGTILSEKNSDTSQSIASLTKIMSAIVALDLSKPTDEIPISQTAANVVPTTIGVVPGQQMSVDELLHAMLMTSANDAAQAVKDGINNMYGEDVFVKAMNEKARFLGLKNTHFANPQGFDDAHNKSSAQDLAILSSYALSHYPEIVNIAQKDYIHLSATSFHKQFDLYNWNGLLDVYPGVKGLKIGNTGDAKYTTIVTATRSGHTVLVVLLGAPGVLQRDLWTSELLDNVFASSFQLPSVNVTTADLEARYQTWHYWQ